MQGICSPKLPGDSSVWLVGPTVWAGPGVVRGLLGPPGCTPLILRLRRQSRDRGPWPGHSRLWSQLSTHGASWVESCRLLAVYPPPKSSEERSCGVRCLPNSHRLGAAGSKPSRGHFRKTTASSMCSPANRGLPGSLPFAHAGPPA